MTSVTKPIRRSVSGIERGRDVVMTIYPGGVLGFRIKRHKKEWTLPIVSAYRLAVQREMDLERAEKRTGKKRMVRRGRL
jgi:hypothetical protein